MNKRIKLDSPPSTITLSDDVLDDIYSDISDDITKTDDFTLSTSQLSATIGTDLTSAWANLKTQLDFVLQAYKNIKIAAEDAVEAANKLNEDYYENNSVIGEDKNNGEKIPLPCKTSNHLLNTSIPSFY